jgi:hypothetical protein
MTEGQPNGGTVNDFVGIGRASSTESSAIPKTALVFEACTMVASFVSITRDGKTQDDPHRTRVSICFK